MAWEFRGNRAYYYRKERTGATVKSVYVGNDEGAQIIARVDEILRLAQREVEKTKRSAPNKPRKP